MSLASGRGGKKKRVISKAFVSSSESSGGEGEEEKEEKEEEGTGEGGEGVRTVEREDSGAPMATASSSEFSSGESEDERYIQSGFLSQKNSP